MHWPLTPAVRGREVTVHEEPTNYSGPTIPPANLPAVEQSLFHIVPCWNIPAPASVPVEMKNIFFSARGLRSRLASSPLREHFCYPRFPGEVDSSQNFDRVQPHCTAIPAPGRPDLRRTGRAHSGGNPQLDYGVHRASPARQLMASRCARPSVVISGSASLGGWLRLRWLSARLWSSAAVASLDSPSMAMSSGTLPASGSSPIYSSGSARRFSFAPICFPRWPRAWVLGGRQRHLLGFWCVALLSKATGRLGRLGFHRLAQFLSLPHAASHRLTRFCHRLPCRVRLCQSFRLVGTERRAIRHRPTARNPLAKARMAHRGSTGSRGELDCVPSKLR